MNEDNVQSPLKTKSILVKMILLKKNHLDIQFPPDVSGHSEKPKLTPGKKKIKAPNGEIGVVKVNVSHTNTAC